MKWIKTITDLKEHIFSNKERVSNRKAEISNEKPRVIYSEICKKIGNKLSQFGFTYYPSQHKLKLFSEDKEYCLEVKFSSSPDNKANQYIELKGSFSVSSKGLRKFTKANPLIDYWNGTIIGRDLGVLIDNDKGNAIWNLANRNDYELALKIIPEICKNDLIKYFETIQNNEIVTKDILKGDFDLGRPSATTQYLLYHNDKKIAEKYLSNYLKVKKELIDEIYTESKAKIKNEGIPDFFAMGHYGYEVALLEEVYELNLK
ncbi:hypothetical protein [Aquimarina sp. AU58]|uniref:hypothetical protein n=1 Tax=Aquimarina sp. AU58 TaxID=1874112 RepID=UPI000D6E899C|nr:hypothetical protein [Aquimarina sp. AU58]